jgi:hypothetical protein
MLMADPLNQPGVQIAIGMADQPAVRFDGGDGIAFMNQPFGQVGTHAPQTQYQNIFSNRSFSYSA